MKKCLILSGVITLLAAWSLFGQWINPSGPSSSASVSMKDNENLWLKTKDVEIPPDAHVLIRASKWKYIQTKQSERAEFLGDSRFVVMGWTVKFASNGKVISVHSKIVEKNKFVYTCDDGTTIIYALLPYAGEQEDE